MLVNSNAILKVSEAVGLSSLPIAGIYAAWGRNELGLRYSELLHAVFPKYSAYVPCSLFCGALLLLAVKCWRSGDRAIILVCCFARISASMESCYAS